MDVEAPMPNDRCIEGSPLPLEQQDTEEGGDIVLDGASRRGEQSWIILLKKAVDAVDLLFPDYTWRVSQTDLLNKAIKNRVRPLVPPHASRPQPPEAVAPLVQASKPFGVPGERSNK